MKTVICKNRAPAAWLGVATVLLGIAPVIKSTIESALMNAFASFASDGSQHGWGDLLGQTITIPKLLDMVTGKEGSTDLGYVMTIGSALAAYLAVTAVVWALNVSASWAQARMRRRYFVDLQLKGWVAALRVTPETERRVLQSAMPRKGGAEPDEPVEPHSGFFSKAVQEGSGAVSDATVRTFGLLQNVITFVTAMFSIRALGMRVTFAFVLVLGVTLLLTGFEGARLKQRRQLYERQRSSLNARTSDILEHRDLIRAWEQTDVTQARLDDIATSFATTDARLDVASTRYSELTSAVYDVGRIAVVAVFAVYVSTATGSTFDVFFASTLYFRLLGPLTSALETVRMWNRTRASTTIYSELVREQEALENSSKNEHAPPVNPAAPELRFSDVTYRYPGQDVPVLRGATFTVPKGKTTLLVGRSGSGKTTIARLAMGFLAPSGDGGTVLIDGTPTADLPLEEVLTRVDYVSQNHHSIHGTVKENLFPEASASDEDLIGRLERVGLDDVTLASDASVLSHGQRQRLALARLFTTTPAGLAILDEPITGVDAFTMTKVYDALRANLTESGRTTLIISHRLVFTELVDHVVMLLDDDPTQPTGVEEGARADMLQPGRAFRALYDQAQAELSGAAGVPQAKTL